MLVMAPFHEEKLVLVVEGSEVYVDVLVGVVEEAVAVVIPCKQKVQSWGFTYFSTAKVIL